MKDYVNVSVYEDYIAVSFYIENEEPFKVGEKLNERFEDAYMNGYNWEAFFNAYLEKNAPEILEILDPDSEAGMYSAYINDVNDETKVLAQRFADLIEHLVENEEEIFEFIEKNSDEIEWD